MDPLLLIVLIVVILWLAGIGVGGPMALGGLIHILLVVVIVILLVRLIQGQRV